LQLDRLNNSMELHINFSPIIYDEHWLEHYEQLFDSIKDLYDKPFKSECIFLTYNDINVSRNEPKVNDLCYKPEIQEYKDSIYRGKNKNIRYKWQLKNEMIKEFKDLYDQYWPLNTIRYIF